MCSRWSGCWGRGRSRVALRWQVHDGPWNCAPARISPPEDGGGNFRERRAFGWRRCYVHRTGLISIADMTKKTALRFDLDALRDRAGDKAFARGESYHRAEQVRLLLIEPARVVAQVSGSEDYRTELTGRGKSIGGHCSCPAFSDYGFCKHMVAVGLAAK